MYICVNEVAAASTPRISSERSVISMRGRGNFDVEQAAQHVIGIAARTGRITDVRVLTLD